MCAVESLHCRYGAAWRHGTAQRLPEFTSRAARARHEGTIESLTYKFICRPSLCCYRSSYGMHIKVYRGGAIHTTRYCMYRDTVGSFTLFLPLQSSLPLQLNRPGRFALNAVSLQSPITRFLFLWIPNFSKPDNKGSNGSISGQIKDQVICGID